MFNVQAGWNSSLRVDVTEIVKHNKRLRFCVLGAAAPNLSLLMHEAFLERDDASNVDKFVQFTLKHCADGGYAEIRRRVETFCSRMLDAKHCRKE